VAPLAAYSNVFVKISGLGVQGQAWTTEQQQPVLQALLSDFGPERCMLASNHPVDALVISLSGLWRGFKWLTRGLAPDKRLALFCDNATKLYGLH
jgi:predicted TIM-barrel fold metal-dependent hydrolase